MTSFPVPVSPVMRTVISCMALAQVHVGKNFLFLLGGYHRESPFSVVQAATHLNGETLAFQYFRHRRGRRVGGINQKSDLFHFRLLFARRRCRQNDHIFERVGEELPGQTGRRSVVITACDGMLHDKLRMKASKRYFVLKVKRVEK